MEESGQARLDEVNSSEQDNSETDTLKHQERTQRRSTARRAQLPPLKRDTITGILSPSDLPVQNFSMNSTPIRLHRPAKVPSQSWQFGDTSPLLTDNSSRIDLYRSAHDRQKVTEIGRSGSLEEVYLFFRIGGRSARRVHEAPLELPVTQERFKQVKETQRQELFRSTLLGKREARNHDRSLTLEGICQDYLGAGLTMRAIAVKHKVSLATVSRVTTKALTQEPLEPPARLSLNRGIPDIDAIKCYCLSLQSDQGFISLSYSSLIKTLKEKFPALRPFSPSDLLQALKNTIRVKKSTFKTKPSRVGRDQFDPLMRGYFILVARLINQNVQVICLDETGFYDSNFANQAVSMEGVPPAKQKRAAVVGIHMIAALSQEGLLGFQLKRTNFSAGQYKNFVRQLLSMLVSQGRISMDKIVLLQDNAPIHRSKVVIAYFNSTNIRILYTLPATPMCNPVEQLFCDIKCQIRRLVHANKEEVTIRLLDQLRQLTSVPGLQYFRRSYREYENQTNVNDP